MIAELYIFISTVCYSESSTYGWITGGYCLEKHRISTSTIKFSPGETMYRVLTEKDIQESEDRDKRSKPYIMDKTTTTKPDIKTRSINEAIPLNSECGDRDKSPDPYHAPDGRIMLRPVPRKD